MYPNWFLGRPVLSAICEQLFPNVTERTARDVLLMWSASKLKQRQSTWELRPSWNSIQTFYFGFDFRNSSRDIYSLSQLRAADTYWLPFDLTPSHVVVHEVSTPKGRHPWHPLDVRSAGHGWCSARPATSSCQWVTLTEAVRDSLHLSLSVICSRVSHQLEPWRWIIIHTNTTSFSLLFFTSFAEDEGLKNMFEFGDCILEQTKFTHLTNTQRLSWSFDTRTNSLISFLFVIFRNVGDVGQMALWT